MTVTLRNITDDFNGFREILRLDAELGASDCSLLEVDLSSVTWIAGNMCAAVGGVLEKHRARSRGIRLVGLREGMLHTTLRKSSFLSSFDPDSPRGPDAHETIIEYRRFERGDTEGFRSYVARQFAGKRMPTMTTALRYRFLLSIGELFENAAEHSRTELGIIACGQYFPTRQHLTFAMADLGIGIRRCFLEWRQLDFTPEQAIDWAMSGNSTVRRDKPGGHGLKLIREFITMNGGRIQIASDAGYWSLHGGDVERARLPAPFPGTVVSITINSADEQEYRLASEAIDPDSIL